MKIATFLRLFIHPHFIVKYYLARDIAVALERYHFTGKILDVGCGVKPYKTLFDEAKQYVGIDFRKYSPNIGFDNGKPDFFFGKDYLATSRLPFKDKEFDHTVSFQVLEHHTDPSLLIQEMVRVTKKGGMILISAPFIGGIHEKPNDYYRFTPFWFLDEFRKINCKILIIKRQGSVLSVVTILCIDYLIELAKKNLLLHALTVCIFPFFLLASYACLVLDKLIPSDDVYLNILVIAKKQ